jgi:hypothetical protein
MHEAITSAAIVRAACVCGGPGGDGSADHLSPTLRVADHNARRLCRSAIFADSTAAAGGRAERRISCGKCLPRGRGRPSAGCSWARCHHRGFWAAESTRKLTSALVGGRCAGPGALASWPDRPVRSRRLNLGQRCLRTARPGHLALHHPAGHCKFRGRGGALAGGRAAWQSWFEFPGTYLADVALAFDN